MVNNKKNWVNLVSPSTFLLTNDSFEPICDWNSWTEWSECTVTCGHITEQRKRKRSKRGSKFCASKEEIETKYCPRINKCPIDCAVGFWSSWTECSQSCGTGFKSRKRSITRKSMFGGMKCSQNKSDYEETSTCVIGHCSVDGEWSEWNRWSYCNTSCGEGKRLRQRNCDSPKPENGGANCIGKTYS